MLEDTQVISFDVGFTLIYPEPAVGHTYAQIAARFGYRFNAREIHSRFAKTWKNKNALNRQEEQENALADEARAYQWWQEIFKDSMGDMLAAEDLQPIFKVCFEEYANGKYWQLYPDVLPTLTALLERSFRLVVLSNWDHRLYQTLKDLGLDHFFEKIYISTLIGHAKPDPDAFRHISNDLKIPAQAILHVGDTLEEDILGARRANIRAVCIDRKGKHQSGPESTPIIPDLTELLEILPHD